VTDSNIPVFRAQLRYDSFDDFIEGYSRFILPGKMFIPLGESQLKPTDSRVRFEFRLADGTRALVGEGVVDAVRRGQEDGDGPTGLVVRYTHLSRRSKQLVGQIVDQKRAEARSQRDGVDEEREAETPEGTETPDSSSKRAGSDGVGSEVDSSPDRPEESGPGSGESASPPEADGSEPSRPDHPTPHQQEAPDLADLDLEADGVPADDPDPAPEAGAGDTRDSVDDPTRSGELEISDTGPPERDVAGEESADRAEIDGSEPDPEEAPPEADETLEPRGDRSAPAGDLSGEAESDAPDGPGVEFDGPEDFELEDERPADEEQAEPESRGFEDLEEVEKSEHRETGEGFTQLGETEAGLQVMAFDDEEVTREEAESFAEFQEGDEEEDVDQLFDGVFQEGSEENEDDDGGLFGGAGEEASADEPFGEAGGGESVDEMFEEPADGGDEGDEETDGLEAADDPFDEPADGGDEEDEETDGLEAAEELFGEPADEEAEQHEETDERETAEELFGEPADEEDEGLFQEESGADQDREMFEGVEGGESAAESPNRGEAVGREPRAAGEEADRGDEVSEDEPPPETVGEEESGAEAAEVDSDAAITAEGGEPVDVPTGAGDEISSAIEEELDETDRDSEPAAEGAESLDADSFSEHVEEPVEEDPSDGDELDAFDDELAADSSGTLPPEESGPLDALEPDAEVAVDSAVEELPGEGATPNEEDGETDSVGEPLGSEAPTSPVGETVPDLETEDSFAGRSSRSDELDDALDSLEDENKSPRKKELSLSIDEQPSDEGQEPETPSTDDRESESLEALVANAQQEIERQRETSEDEEAEADPLDEVLGDDLPPPPDDDFEFDTSASGVDLNENVRDGSDQTTEGDEDDEETDGKSGFFSNFFGGD